LELFSWFVVENQGEINMTFLVLVLTVGAYKVLGWHFRTRHDSWFFKLCDSLKKRLQEWPRLAMLLTLLIPLFIVSVVLSMTHDWLFGFAGVLLQVLILSYALGRVNLFEQLKEYEQHWRSGDFQSAYHHAEKQFNLELGFTADDRNSLHASTCQGFLYQWFEQVFVIIFWYLLAGPLAALFLRLLSLYEARVRQDGSEGALQLLHVLEWLPARLLVVTFAIAGNFALCFKALLDIMLDYTMSTAAVLFQSGLAAAGLSESQFSTDSDEERVGQLQALQRLMVRSLVVCMILVALLTIF